MEAAAQTFEVPYTVNLQWHVEPHTSPDHTPVDFPDSALLAIVYTGATASRDCLDQLEVPVSVTLSTSESGIAESGNATLLLSRSSRGLQGKLSYQGKRVRLTAELPDPASSALPLASLDALDSDLPGASASFTEAL